MGRTSSGSGQPQQLYRELQQQMLDEARHLRSVAAAVRERVKRPELEHYVRSGRGPSYQHDYNAWMKTTHAAYAIEEAAARLEEALASPRT